MPLAHVLMLAVMITLFTNFTTLNLSSFFLFVWQLQIEAVVVVGRQQQQQAPYLVLRLSAQSFVTSPLQTSGNWSGWRKVIRTCWHPCHKNNHSNRVWKADATKTQVYYFQNLQIHSKSGRSWWIQFSPRFNSALLHQIRHEDVCWSG